MDEKAFFGIEPADRIASFGINANIVVDNQALFIYSLPNRYYLFIFARRCNSLRNANAIAVTSTGSSGRARFDDVRVIDHRASRSCRINRIYTIRGREQMRKVRDEVCAPSLSTAAKG